MSSDKPTAKLFWPNWLLWAALALFYLVTKFGFHELWKDEWQAWLMARDMGWGELWGALFYEGHPGLWYSYLKLWTYISQATGLSGELSLHVAHSLPVLASFWLVFFRFNLPLWVKPLLLLGHFFFFEYGMVDRGYSLVILFCFLAALSFPLTEKNAWKTALYLFLLCQTEVFGVLMAGAITLYGLLQNQAFPQLATAFRNAGLRKMITGFGLGLLVFVGSVWPRGEEEALSRAYTSVPFSKDNFAEAFQGQFANTFLIGGLPDTNVFGVTGLGLGLSLVVLLALLYFFAEEKRSLASFGAFVAVTYLFFVAFYPGGVRQWGMLYVFFAACLHWRFGSAAPINKARWGILLVFMGFQLYYCSLALSKEYRYPFSQSIHAGRFIQENVPENVPVVAINKFATAPVGGYANRPLFFLPNGEEFTYFKWLEKVYLPPEQELKLFAEFKKVKGIVVLTAEPLDPARYPNARLWKSFDGYNLKNENYYLYALER